ncbi:MAG: hypothetical protein U7123_02160 [Potamolinea sp.]
MWENRGFLPLIRGVLQSWNEVAYFGQAMLYILVLLLVAGGLPINSPSQHNNRSGAAGG